MSLCTLCPRNCSADRENGKTGYCQVAGSNIILGRASLHMWEEPCISGEKGSGTIFFIGCPLRCIYCQNYSIAHVDPSSSESFVSVTEDRLGEIMLGLQSTGASNINLVTPTHYSAHISGVLKKLRDSHLLRIPVVYNCSGYEKPDTLKLLEGLVDIYLTDFKYMDPVLGKDFSNAPDYPKVCQTALEEMFRQMKLSEDGTPYSFDDEGIMKRGIIVRNLLLPGHVKNSKAVVEYVYKTYGDAVFLSLMNQYTPPLAFGGPELKYPELNRKTTKREYEKLISYALELGVANAFVQEGAVAESSFIPLFDGTVLI